MRAPSGEALVQASAAVYEPFGLLAASDTLRPEVPAAVAALRAPGLTDIEVLTGDNERTAATLAQTLGVLHRPLVEGELLAQDEILGRVAADWSRFVQGPRRYRLASVPTTISTDEVHRLLTTVDRRSAVGRRNYAIPLLLAVFGLRAREVVDLRLDDINWRAGIVGVQRSKTSRPLVLPLTAAVGRALVTYLQHGRPRTDAREIFVRHDGRPIRFRKRWSLASHRTC